MNFNYSDTNYLRSSGYTRVGSPNTMRVYESQNNYYPETRYYQPEVDEQSTYYLSIQNSELNSALYEEKRQNRELSGQLNFKISEAEAVGTKLKIKSDELDSLKIRYEQSEQIRQEQSKLIDSMQKEIENIKKKLAEKDQELGPSDDTKSDVSSKPGPKQQAAKNGNTAKPGFLQKLVKGNPKTPSATESKPPKK